MHVLFIHANFPGQFRYIAPRLMKDYGYQCSFVAERKERQIDAPGMRPILYTPRGGATAATHIATRNFENCVASAQGVYDALKAEKDLKPDLIVAHTGFGSSLFLPYLFDAPIINLLEFFYHPIGQDLGYRPEVPLDEITLLRCKTNNAMTLLDVVNCEQAWTPAKYQRDYFPPELRSKIEVIFDGCDTDIFHRKPGARGRLNQSLNLDPNSRIITYVARGLEMMRGFDIFMKAARLIYQKFPNVTFIIVGADKVHYGGDMRYVQTPTFREHVLSQDDYDLSKFRFTGFIPQEMLADVLSINDLHVYMTEPFVTSWSMINAMSCGGIVLASDQACVREYITPDVDGLLFNFFNAEELAGRALEILNKHADFRHLGNTARATVMEKYSVDVAMPKLKDFFERVASQKREPSILMEKLVRAGTLPRLHEDPELARPPQERPPTDPNAGSELDQAIARLRNLPNAQLLPEQWVQVSHGFRGPPGIFESIGPNNHAIDLTRLMQRLSQWQPIYLLDLGAQEGGTIFLWTRAATDRARILVAGDMSRPLPAEKIPFFNAMARPMQSVHCLPAADSDDQLEMHIQKELRGSKLDFLFLHGRRPYAQLAAAYQRYAKYVRSGGLIAWDGIHAMIKTSDTDGGDRLWTEIRPHYPQRAEYLQGAATEVGGIAVIKV